mgnify:CR=1 FL=1
MAAQVTNVWYNPNAAAFEGRVDIRRGGTTFRYPCMVQGPAGMHRAAVDAQMLDQARRMSDS